MIKPTKNWLKEAVISSNIPKLVSNLQVNMLIKRAMRAEEGSFVGFEVLLCATTICETGLEKNFSDDILNKIIKESELILKNKPKNDIIGLNFLGSVRDLRPAWFSCPIYLELLKPFNHQIRIILGSDIEEIFKAALTMADSKEDMPLPAPLLGLESALTIQHSEINSPADLWDKLFVQLNDDSLITLTYKIADVIYLAICKILQEKIPQFGENKGKSLELLIKKRIKEFMSPKQKLYHSYYIYTINNEKDIEIENNEKDLLVIGKDIVLAFECKATRIRGSSADWSMLNASDDARPVLHALKQIEAPIKLLKNGGKFHDDHANYKIGPKKITLGFIITDQIYTPYIRASIDDIINKEKYKSQEKYQTWHGEEIYVGSVLDFCFLLEVAMTFSLLTDYLQWIRSNQNLRYCDEPEAWLFYCLEPVLSVVRRFPIGVNVIGNGFDWKKVRFEGLKKYHLFWLERSDLVKKMDFNDFILNAINIITQDRNKATRSMKQKEKEIKLSDPIDANLMFSP